MIFTAVVSPMVIELVEGRTKGAREFYAGGGLVFYIQGSAEKRIGAVMNACMNKAIELGVRPRELKRVCAPCAAKKAKKLIDAEGLSTKGMFDGN